MFEKSKTKFNKASSRSNQRKEEVATLQKELAELASTQGVKLALKILNDYYAKALLTVQAVNYFDVIFRCSLWLLKACTRKGDMTVSQPGFL